MKLYILKAIDIKEGPDPWSPPYDCNHGFIISAETEYQAQRIANTRAAYEGKVWDDPEFTTCQELTPPLCAGIIMADFHAG